MKKKDPELMHGIQVLFNLHKIIIMKLKYILLLPLLTSTLVFFNTSCEKKSPSDDQEIIKPEDNKIVISFGGIKEDELITKSASNKLNTEKPQLVEGSEFDVITSVDNKLDGSNFTIDKTKFKSTNDITENIKYTFYLYKKTGNDYVFDKSINLTANTPQSAEVEVGAQYKWVAMSLNSTTEDFPTVANGGQVSLPGNKDIIRAAGEFTASAGNNNINAIFNRVVSRIGIELNTMGMFAPLTGGNVTVSGISSKTGTLNLIDGTIVGGLTTATLPTVSLASFIAEDLSATDQSLGKKHHRTFYYYTLEEVAQNIRVQVANPIVGVDLKALPNNEQTAERSFTGTLNQTKSITPTRGKNHRLLVALTETPLIRDGVSWARSNLYYTGPTQSGQTMTYNPYRFYHNNITTNDDRGYFAFRGHLPKTWAENNVAKQKDPCALIYPAGLWKTPIDTELNTLTGGSPALLTDVIGNILDALISTPGTSFTNTENKESFNYSVSSFGQPTTTGLNSAYAQHDAKNNSLNFPANGFYTATELLNLVDLQLGNFGEFATFWTSNTVTGNVLGLNLDGLANIGAYGFSGGRTLLGGSSASKSLGVANIGLLGSVSVIKTPFMNVRCVRDNTWVTKSASESYNPMPDYSQLF